MATEFVARRPSWTERTDADLVEAARGGHPGAFEELYRRHSGAARAALSDNVHDGERRRELLQDVFTRAFAQLGALRDPEKFRTWVLQIARNAAIDDLRARTSVRLETIDDHPDLSASDDSPELVAEMRWMAAAIESGLAGLTEREAAAVSMTLHLGFGPREIAAALGTSYGNAKVIVHRARLRLKETLAREDAIETAGDR